MNKNVRVLFALSLLCFLVLGCIGQEEEEVEPTVAPTTPPPPGMRVAIVFATGGLGDKSFNDTCYEGVTKAKADFGIEFDYVEPTAIAEYEGFHRQYAKSDEYDLIIGTDTDKGHH